MPCYYGGTCGAALKEVASNLDIKPFSELGIRLSLDPELYHSLRGFRCSAS